MTYDTANQFNLYSLQFQFNTFFRGFFELSTKLTFKQWLYIALNDRLIDCDLLNVK